MLAQMYQNLVLKNPKAIFILLLISILSFGYYSKDFRLDASSETLLIDGDPDLVAHLAQIIIGKQRHGPIGNVTLEFEERFTKFKDTQTN